MTASRSRGPRPVASAGLAILLAVVVSAQSRAPAQTAARPAAKEAASLLVAVADPAGKPVAGAFVMARSAKRAYPSLGSGLPEKPRSTLTGSDGTARLDSLPAGPWALVVHARGFVTWRDARVVAGPVTLRLERGGSVTGLVREARTRRPLSGVRVSVSESGLATGGWEDDVTRNEATTDAKGRFRLDGIGDKPVRIAARAPGFDRAEREAHKGAQLELFLFPGAALTGAVQDDGGRRVKGATVWVEGDRPGRVPPAERTDARGEFALYGIRPGDYTVVAREGARALGIAAVLVEPEAEARTSILLSEGGFVTGRVVDPDGRPLAGRLRVEVVDGHGLPSSVSEMMAASAGADGRFVLGPLPVAALGIGVSAPRHAARRVEVTTARRGAADLADVVLETGLAIRGRVRDSDDHGIDGATLRARLRRPVGRSQFEATSEADGSFVVAGVEPGTYELVARASGYAAARTSVTAGGDAVDLVLEPGGEIAGRVVDSAGQPAEDATLEAQRSDEEIAFGGSGSADEGDGRFVLRDLAAGRYVLQARASGRGEASVAGVRVAAGVRTDVGTLRLGGGGVVRGTVVDVNGEGVPGATVNVERDLSMFYGELVDQTRSTGAFEIRGVPPGRVSVLVSHPAYATPKPVVAEVELDKEPVPVRIVLHEGARVEGRALHRDGRPFSNAQVRFTGVADEAPGMWQQPTPVGPDGWFTIDHVAGGRTRFELLAPSGPGRFAGLASREVELYEGQTAAVDFLLKDVVVAGVVTRGGQPEPGVRVTVRSRAGGAMTVSMGGPARALEAGSGPPFLAATTREDGSYELLVFAPGPALVILESVLAIQRYPSRSVDVPDVDRFNLDLEVAEASVSGLVVAKESGEPLADAYVRIQGASGATRADGRFTLAAEPGDRELEARAPGRAPVTLPLSVGPDGLSDVRVELARGLGLRGRVLGAASLPAAGVAVVAMDPAGEMVYYIETLADGSFRMDGLKPEPYTLLAGGDLPGWAVRGGVTPGDEVVTLALRPGGRIAVRIRAADGQPVAGTFPEVRRVGGLTVEMPGGAYVTTDANGLVEIPAPPGVVELEAGGAAGRGRGSVTVRAGETVPLEIVLSPPAPK